jgi:hypothetical protein
LNFRPKPPPEELTAAFKSALRDVPAAVVETSASTVAPAPVQEEPSRAGEGGRRRKAPAVVQINLNVTEMLADIISDEAKKAGSTRRWLARLMKDAGYDVPDADLTPYMNVRKRRS